MPSSTLRVGGGHGPARGRGAAGTAFPRGAWERDYDVTITPLNGMGIRTGTRSCSSSGSDSGVGKIGAPPEKTLKAGADGAENDTTAPGSGRCADGFGEGSAGSSREGAGSFGWRPVPGSSPSVGTTPD